MLGIDSVTRHSWIQPCLFPSPQVAALRFQPPKVWAEKLLAGITFGTMDHFF